MTATFGPDPVPRTEFERRIWRSLEQSFEADNIYLECADRILHEAGPFDLMMVYLGLVDVVSHKFWRYLQPEVFENPPDAEELARYHDVIRLAHAWVDDAIGRLLAAVPEDAEILVLSDHGFYAVNHAGAFDPEAGARSLNSGDHQEGPPGVFVAAGPAFRTAPSGIPPAGEWPRVGGVLDVFPTLARLLGLPRAEDRPGRVLGEILADPPGRSGPVVPTFEDLPWRRGGPVRLAEALAEEAALAEQSGAGVLEGRLEELRELGYPVGDTR
jgi:hypothetical protein